MKKVVLSTIAALTLAAGAQAESKIISPPSYEEPSFDSQPAQNTAERYETHARQE